MTAILIKHLRRRSELLLEREGGERDDGERGIVFRPPGYCVLSNFP